MAELALGVAGLTAGIPGLVQVIGTLGKTLLQRVEHSGDQYHKELELVIQTTKSQAQEICLHLHGLGQSVPESLKDDILQIFQALRSTFERLIRLVPATSQAAEKPKLSAATKAKIDSEVRAIEDWNTRMFHRAMIFVNFGQQKTAGTAQLRDLPDEYRAVALKKVEKLRESVGESLEKAKDESNLLLIYPEEQKEQTICVALPNSSLELRRSKIDDTSVLVEYRTYSDSALEREIHSQRRIVREVARILRRADPELMGLLYCDGFLWDSLKCRFELHFPIPSGLQDPRTLLDLLTDSSTRRFGIKHPLNQRIALAKSIVMAVFVLHSASLVHKQIRPDNVVIFENSPLPTGTQRDTPERQRYPYVLGKPFLVGFDNVRNVDAASLLLPVEDWKKNIYLSPRRQRLQQGDEFQMEDDMYSVGVVLIEIAFWASFQDKSAAQLWKLVWQDASQSALKGPGQLKKTYISLAAGAVPRKMGQKYADIVMACLTGLESEQGDLKRLEDEDGIVVGTRYMVEVISKLEEIIM
ncbi:hypothetical protein BHE90_000964 [Fusarium euwallaceae]|uniref:Protein kinase domain-containing protein n=1 Tax=Fusarium euwallaceae TaxID=1147111 RepID=A0A430M8Z9_9HYPO|nr:hypothetical protein BHE90_000964 [Fusarium euwallaceae]